MPPKKVKLLVNKYSEELAEFIGIMLGDGNISRYNGAYSVRIAGNSITDREYFLKYVRHLAYKLFKVRMGIYFFKKSNSFHLTIANKDLVHTLEYFGLKAGNKLKNNVSIPNWVFKSDKYLKACIRGLIDTDGTVLPITGRNYTYVWFTSGIPNLRKSFEKAMSKLGYKIAKWNISTYRGPETYIGAKALIRKYYEDIGFSNPKNEKRFMMPKQNNNFKK
tara:strand:- start:21 stop:680 length:660 start_codon:yes stop_codon:yes gene_type:complete